MSSHKRQLSDTEQPRPQPSISAAALNEIDAASRQHGFIFADDRVFGGNQHAVLHILHLDPHRLPYVPSKQNVALRLATIFEACSQLVMKDPAVDIHSPEFWKLAKITILKYDDAFQDAEDSVLALCHDTIIKYHAAWNEFGRQSPDEAQELLSRPAMDTPEANVAHRLHKKPQVISAIDRQIDEYLATVDDNSTKREIQMIKKHLRKFLRAQKKKEERALVEEYSRGKKEGYDLGFAAGVAAKEKYKTLVAGYRVAADRALGMLKRWFGAARQQSPVHDIELVEIEELRQEVAHMGEDGFIEADDDTKEVQGWVIS
ncbi:hypothetical protein K4K48_009916 [Colletotrichum sp. SAR 10_66]|nr:hypothetical protein K4K51_012108 [Colletotrichum sp. SAR 10_75]KAJ5004433.1 hypothetical protein K4K48_009916 [Colletotrichum sp. SAR 10_66]